MKVDAWDIVALLREGKDDSKYRKLASQSVDTLVEFLQQKKLTSKLESSDQREAAFAVFDLSKIPGHQDLELALGYQNQGTTDHPYPAGLYSKIHGKYRITITFDDSSEKYIKADSQGKLDSNYLKKMKKDVEASASDLLKKKRSIYIHEFIHHLDRQRINPAVWKKGLEYQTGGSEYYSHPVELNAYLQQGMAKMADQLRHVKTKEGRRLVMGATPQEFVQKLMKRMEPGFIQHLTEPNKRKLAKRAYQLWGELTNASSTG